MPNHTHCILTIAGESDKTLHEIINPYMGMNTSEPPELTLDLNKIIPMPDTVSVEETSNPDGGMPDWYIWRVGNWGTKWNTYLMGYDGRFLDEADWVFHFYTAWAPPLPCIQRLAELTGVALQLCYLDEGNCYIGKYTALPSGEENDECYGDVDKAPKDLREEFGELCEPDEMD
jgi:hypothetical protein